MSLVLPDSQTQATNELSILDTIHVEGLPVMLLAGRRPWLVVTLVLRQKVKRWKDQHPWKQRINKQRVDILRLVPTFSMMARRDTLEGRASTPVGGSSTMLRQLGHFRGRRRGRQME